MQQKTAAYFPCYCFIVGWIELFSVTYLFVANQFVNKCCESLKKLN